MFDPDDCTLCPDNLFFNKPIIHKVRPLHQDAVSWQLEDPPPLSQIPNTQDMQAEAEYLHTLHNFSGNPKPPYNVQAGTKVLPQEISNADCYNPNERGTESSDSSRWDGLWGGDLYRDHSKNAVENGRGGEEMPLSLGHSAVNQWCLPSLRRSLFKAQVLNRDCDPMTLDDHMAGGRQAASRTQTFPGQVPMATVPPPPPLPPLPPPLRLSPSLSHPEKPRATLGHVAPPPSPERPFSPPTPLGSYAESGRHQQQAARAETQDRGTKRAFVPPMTPQPLLIQGSCEPGILRPVSEIPAKFRSVFNEFPFFNYVQSKALDNVLYSGKNFVACAPTGSGKTVLFELAIVRLLLETSEPWKDVKAVYMAPIKALCSQCFESWNKKFSPLGLTCKELTGDTEIDDLLEIQDSHIILTTPEKWDSMTRKWRDNCLLQLVRLFLIDEVHVVKDTTRGATLEVVVSRMKAVHAYRTAQNPDAGLSMRFVAVSATIPNVSDIADWLSDEFGPATYLNMDESHRPVKLRKVVLGFPCNSNQTDFKFDLSLNYKMANIIQTYSDQKPALVFCSTRKGAQQSAAVLAKDARFILSVEHKQRLIKYANSIHDSRLKELVMLGVGYHHAGLDVSDRKMIEKAFMLSDLPVLFTTRTLAMGVNLPAHLVVIKSTTQYVAGSCEEYSEADLFQMIGRAGRPQFDTSATAVIMTKMQNRDKYLKLMNGMEIIESSLHSHLVEHLNAEIVLGTISDVNMALDWIRSTFLYIRTLQNPTHYGFSKDLDRCGIESKLQELCLRNLNALSSIGLIQMDEDINIKPTEVGRLMARYCIAFDTIKMFSHVSGTENLSDLIVLLSKSKEFSDIQLRMSEKRPLNTLNRDKNMVTIRFPIEGKIKTNEMKVNCLIQAQLGSIFIQEFGLTQEMSKIFRNGMRISKCLVEFLSLSPTTGFSALLNSLILAKCFRAKLWENSPFVSKQLEKIGQTLSTAMVDAGLTSFSKIEQTNPRELELIVNRHPPFGNQIRESVSHLPKYEVTLEQLPRYNFATAEIVVKVSLKNHVQLLSRRTAPNYHYVSLIIGNADNSVIFLQKLMDCVLLRSGSWSRKIEVAKSSKGHEININLISSEYVGLDIQQKFQVSYSGDTNFGTDNPNNVPSGGAAWRAQQSTNHTEPGENVTPAAHQELGVTRQCNHFCKNKNLCGHDCCKVGVAVGRKRSSNQESSFSSHLKDLQSRYDSLSQTPVKKLKMKMNEELEFVSMQEFTFKPRQKLPAVSAEYRECQYVGSMGPADSPETVDLTAEDGVHLFSDLYDDETDVSYGLEDIQGVMDRPGQSPAALHGNNLGSTVWMKPGFCASANQNHYWDRSQIKTNSTVCLKSSVAAPNRSIQGKNASSSQRPCVGADLGDEWDDWGDFDEENLVSASETSATLCTANYNPQVPPSADASKPGGSPLGFQMGSLPVPLGHSQVQPTASTGQGKADCSQATVRPPNRITLDRTKKTYERTPGIFSEGFTVQTQQDQTHQASLTPLCTAFGFFSTVNNVAGTSISTRRSTDSYEEEAFLGIFDGIF